jgi:hypothetical protein
MTTIADIALRVIACELCSDQSLCRKHQRIANSFGETIGAKVLGFANELRAIQEERSLENEE